MADNAQPTTQTAPPQPPELHPPPPPFGDPPLATQPTEVAGQTTSQPTVAPGEYAPPAGPPPGASVPDPVSAAVAPAQPNADPFADNNQNTAVTQPQEPPQHPDRPLPTGPVTQTPLYSEPTPILPPRPQPPFVPEQTPPPPRASFDQMPDHPAIQQSFLGRAQSPPQSVQHVSITPVQPQPVAPPQAPVLDANANTLESDPAIASLHAMFPAFDLLVIQSVLEASDNNKDLAIDSLLSMSDPEYVSAQTQPAGGGAPNQRRELTQTELDEEFARRLMLEEEQQARGGSWPQEETYPHSGQVPYQTFQPRRSGEYQRPSAGHGGGIGDMANDLQQQFRSFIGGARGTATQPQPQTQGSSGAGFQDQLNRFADTGKRTFNSVFNKVKQKMEEFDRQHPPDTQNMNRPPQSGHWSNWQGPSVGQPQQPATYAQSPAPSHPAPAPQSPPPVTSHGALNSNPFEDIPADRQTDANTAALPRSSGRWQYQPEPAAAASPPAQPQAPATGAVTTEEPRRSIDTSRLGLLPKRPVSLMDVNANTRPAAAAAPAPGRTTERDSDEESLEYVDRPMPGGMNRP